MLLALKNFSIICKEIECLNVEHINTSIKKTLSKYF